MLRRECIAYFKQKMAFIQIDKFNEKVLSKRVRDAPSQMTMDTFPFVDPHFVGKSNADEVFLSDLECVHRGISGDAIGLKERYRSNGILNHRTGFDLHPFIDGSGDHLNSSLLNDIVYQFCHLVVRNGRNVQYPSLNAFFSRIGRFDASVRIAVVDARISFVRYMELNAFEMVLHELDYVEDGDERMESLHFRPAFAFEMTVSLNQSDKECAVVKVLVVPLYRTACL